MARGGGSAGRPRPTVGRPQRAAGRPGRRDRPRVPDDPPHRHRRGARPGVAPPHHAAAGGTPRRRAGRRHPPAVRPAQPAGRDRRGSAAAAHHGRAGRPGTTMTAAPSEPVRRLSLQEHATLTVPPPPLDPAAVEALRLCDAVTVTGQGHQIELRSKSLVGVIRAGPVELRITPKLTIRRLLWLLGYARNPKGWHDDDIVGLTEVDPEDTVTAVAVSFVAATRRALAAGLLQGYRTIEQTDLVLRGRLRE